MSKVQPDEIVAGWNNVPLNEQGWKEANGIGQSLAQAGVRFDKTYSSDLQRALSTASIIAAQTKSPAPIAMAQLRPLNPGNYTGRPESEFNPAETKAFKQPATPIPGGESINEYSKRWVGAVNPILEESKSNPDKRYLVGTHSRDIEYLNGWLHAGAPSNEAVDITQHPPPPDNPGSMWKVEINDKRKYLLPVDVAEQNLKLPPGVYFQRHALTNSDDGEGQLVGEQPEEVLPFNELAKNFDPMMPLADFNRIQEHYYYSVIAPQLGSANAVQAGWEKFQEATDRKPLLSTTEGALTTLMRGAAEAGKETVAPFASIISANARRQGLPDPIKALDDQTDLLDKVARRDSTNVDYAKMVGSFVGQGIPLSAAVEGAAPLVQQAVSKALLGATAQRVANRLLTGGLAFSTIQAAREQTGGRLVAGLKGFGEGMAFEAGLGLLSLPSYLRGAASPSSGIKIGPEVADSVARDVAQGNPVPKIVDQEAAKYVQNQREVARVEARPQAVFQDEGRRGVYYTVLDRQGTPTEIRVKPGEEAASVNFLNNTIDKGGELVSITHHPDDKGTFMDFLNTIRDKYAGKYDSVHLVTTPGEADTYAQALSQKGYPAHALSDDHVQIEVAPAAQPFETRVPDVSPEIAEVMASDIGQAKPEAGLMEEKFRLGGGRQARTSDLPIPPSEQRVPAQLGDDPGLLERMGIKGVFNPLLRFHKFAVTMDVPPQFLQKMGQGVAGTWENWQKLLNFAYPKGGLDALPRGWDQLSIPGIVWEKGTGESTRYHELVHAGLDHLQTSFVQMLKPMANRYFGPEKTFAPPLEMISIAKALKGDPVYSDMKLENLLNEAFTYSAEAIRYGDKGLIKSLGNMNGGPKGIFDLVNQTSKTLLDQVPGKVDGIPGRMIQRGLEDLVRRTDPAVTYNLRRAANNHALDAFWNGERWALRTSDDTIQHYSDLKEAWDDLAERDKGLDHEPGLSFYAEQHGVRGPLKPGGPPRTPPMPTEPIGEGYKKLGWTALRGIFEPTIPWAAAADKKFNSLLAPRGEKLPIYDTVKDLMEGIEKASPYKADLRNQFGSILKDVPSEKLHDYFEVLTRIGVGTEKEVVPGEYVTVGTGPGASVQPKVNIKRVAGQVPQDLADRFKMSPADVEAVRKVQGGLLDLQDQTKIPIMEYLGVGSTTGQPAVQGGFFQRLRNAAWNPGSVWGQAFNAGAKPGFWEDAVRNGRGNFDPQDTHLGRFLGWLTDQAAEKQFLEKPLAKLDQIVNRKSADGQYVLGPIRWPLYNLSRYTRGIPDTSQQIINSVLGTFTQNAGKVISRVNEHLPESAKLPEDLFGSAQGMLSKWLLFSYAAGAGLRPAFVVRDAFQAFHTGLPVLGPSKFATGMAKTLTRDGWEAAERAGAHLGETSLGDMYGDVFAKMDMSGGGGRLDKLQTGMVRLANAAVAPMRFGNDMARTLVYNGEHDTTLPLIEQLRKGQITSQDFIMQSSLKAHDEANISRLLPKALNPNVPAEDVARRIALDTVQLTQWPYLRGAQPALLRTGVGRLFGQYGNWPLSYISFLGRMAGKMGNPMFRNDAIKSTATWVATNYLIGTLMEQGLGVDGSSWLFGSPAVYEGGPALRLGGDLMKSIGDTDEARQARKDLLTTPRYLIPGFVEMKNIITSINEHPDPGYKDFMSVMGFKPLDKLGKDRDIQQWLSWQAGFGGK